MATGDPRHSPSGWPQLPLTRRAPATSESAQLKPSGTQGWARRSSLARPWTLFCLMFPTFAGLALGLPVHDGKQINYMSVIPLEIVEAYSLSDKPL